LNQNINSDIVYSLIKINLKTSNSTGSLCATRRFGLSIRLLTERYQLNIIAPFHLSVNGEKYIIDALIEGYGARKGMLIFKNANTIKDIRDEIVAL